MELGLTRVVLWLQCSREVDHGNSKYLLSTKEGESKKEWAPCFLEALKSREVTATEVAARAQGGRAGSLMWQEGGNSVCLCVKTER